MNTCQITSRRIIVTRMVSILEVQWNPPVSPEIQHFECSACKNPLGNRRWAEGWASEDGQEFGMRLCEDCAAQAEKFADLVSHYEET